MPSIALAEPRTDADTQHRPPELDRVKVEYADGIRSVTCFCGRVASRSIVPHFKQQHPAEWATWIAKFIHLRGSGWPLKRIMRLFKAGSGHLLFSWTVIERSIRGAVESGDLEYLPPPKRTVARWEPDESVIQKTTVWDFPRRGDWAVHSGDYRGNWPPEIPRNLILRHTSPGDLVVDAFAGGGTTLIEAWLLDRRSIGLDVSRLAIQTCNAKLREMETLAATDNRVTLDPHCRPIVLQADALRIAEVLAGLGIGPGEVTLACAHPPYLNSIAYTGGNGADLSGIGDPGVFTDKLRSFAKEMGAVLAPSGVLALLMGDVPKAGKTIHLGNAALAAFVQEGFELETTVVKTQHRDRSSEFYYSRAGQNLLMAHEYLFILRKTIHDDGC